jgi:hypothetical protein
LDTGEATQEPPDDTLVTGRDEVHGSLAVPGYEHPQVGMEAITDPSHLRDEVFAGLHEEGDLETPIGHPDWRQIYLPRGHPGDREGIAGIALARPPRPGPFPARQLWRNLPDEEPGPEKEASCGGPEARAALDTDDRPRGHRPRPDQEVAMSWRVVAKRPFSERSTKLVDGAGGERVLVRVDPDGGHPGRASEPWRYDGRGPGGHMCVE